jgi:hypothetical protein
MLHAFTHGKTRLHKRYLGHRDEGEGRVYEEDEITALLMGPLDYLPAEAVGRFWKALILLGRDIPDLPFPSEPVERAEMFFWPRQGIEPDLLVKLDWPTGERRILLFEFKWHASLSGDQQLHLQWENFLTADERKEAYHLFIAPELSAGLNAIGARDIWNGRLLLRSWISILGVLSALDCSGYPGLDRWRAQVAAFLWKVEVKPFQGFSGLVPPVTANLSPVFWRPLNGFAMLTPPVVPPLTSQRPSFMWSSER